MKCPICNLDLSPLDLVSRTEHVNLCVENGPSIVEIGDDGQAVIKKNIPLAKQRKICPICDKTFQTINQHFKTCALKFDVPPDLMIEHWEKINSGSKNPKKFPRDLLDNFVKKCIKEGRFGYQLDKARALSLSMGGSELQNDDSSSSTCVQLVSVSDHDDTSQNLPRPQPGSANLNLNQPPPVRDVNQVLMQSNSSETAQRGSTASKKSFRLELVSESTKKANIALRIDREVAATRSRRYEEALRSQYLKKSEQDDDCVMVDELATSAATDVGEQNKLFFRARLKDCMGSELCLSADCTDHELLLLMDDFVVYSGRSMDAPPKQSADPPVSTSSNSILPESQKKS